MKKNLFSLFFTLSATLLLAQSLAPKFSLLEHYTNTRCGSCGANNPGFYTKALPYFNKNVNHISYHPSYPYPSCAIHLTNTTENNERFNYYGANNVGTPTYIINGKGAVKSVTSLTTAILDAEKVAKSPLQVNVKEISGVAGWTANVKLKGFGSFTALNYSLMAAVCEKTYDYNAPNGEKVHHDVFRKMITPTSGKPILVMPGVGQVAEINLNYTLDSSWDATETYVLVWVVDAATKEVINSGSKFTTVVGTEDLIEDEKVSIYPNPASDILNLDLSKASQKATRYQIFNNLGQMVQEAEINNDVMQINVAALPVNQYLIKITTKEGAIVRSFLRK